MIILLTTSLPGSVIFICVCGYMYVCFCAYVLAFRRRI